MTLKSAIFVGACLFAPEMVAIGLAAHAAAKIASAEYMDEVACSDRFLKEACDGDPGAASLKAASVTSDVAVGLAPFTCGASALFLHREACRMRDMRETAMVAYARRQRGLKKGSGKGGVSAIPQY